MDRRQVAMEITKAVIEKSMLHLGTSHDTPPQAHNEFVANEVAKMYKTIYNAVIDPSN